jgi:predicted ATPase
VGDLVDASLVTITDDPFGEPRIGMLQTNRTYALEQLAAAGETEGARRRHAEHYAGMTKGLRPMLDGPEFSRATSRFQLDLDNFREALRWGFSAVGRDQPTGADRLRVALQVAQDFPALRAPYRLLTECRSWLELALRTVQGGPSAGAPSLPG